MDALPEVLVSGGVLVYLVRIIWELVQKKNGKPNGHYVLIDTDTVNKVRDIHTQSTVRDALHQERVEYELTHIREQTR